MTSPADEAATARGNETRHRILDRAMSLSGRLGLEGLTIGELASDLGLSKSGLYAHFKSKENLQLAVLDAAAEHFKTSVFVPALKQPRGEPRVRALFERWLDWIRSKDMPGGCVFVAAASEWDDRQGPVRERLVEWFARLDENVARAAQIAVEERHFRDDLDVQQFAYDLHGVVLKFHIETRLMHDGAAPRKATAAFERLLADARA